jgi:hypothetical protein
MDNGLLKIEDAVNGGGLLELGHAIKLRLSAW